MVTSFPHYYVSGAMCVQPKSEKLDELKTRITAITAIADVTDCRWGVCRVQTVQTPLAVKCFEPNKFPLRIKNLSIYE